MRLLNTNVTPNTISIPPAVKSVRVGELLLPTVHIIPNIENGLQILSTVHLVPWPNLWLRQSQIYDQDRAKLKDKLRNETRLSGAIINLCSIVRRGARLWWIWSLWVCSRKCPGVVICHDNNEASAILENANWVGSFTLYFDGVGHSNW